MTYWDKNVSVRQLQWKHWTGLTRVCLKTHHAVYYTIVRLNHDPVMLRWRAVRRRLLFWFVALISLVSGETTHQLPNAAVHWLSKDGLEKVGATPGFQIILAKIQPSRICLLHDKKWVILFLIVDFFWKLYCVFEVMLIIVLLIAGLVIDLGGGSDHDRIGFRVRPADI